MMQPDELRSRLGGVIGFPVTPFKKDYTLDLDAVRTNVLEMVKMPLCAVVAAGGTGELYSLTPGEHQQVIAATAEAVGGAVPVIAGVGFGSALAVHLAKQAEEAGADGILCFPPYYTNAPFEGLLQYYSEISKATELGLLIYSRDWASFSPTEVYRLAESLPNLVAWKDGQGDLRRLQAVMERVGNRLHWVGGVGDDLVPGYYAIGIRTYTSSIAAIAPRLSMQLHERASMLDSGSLSRLMSNYVLPLYAIRTRRKGYEVSVMKCAMEILGKPAGPVRPPLPEVRPEDREHIAALMHQFKPVL
jgi:5-dehydro-4-deoxyglucarate dehydratase